MGKLHILGHYCNMFGMYSTQIRNLPKDPPNNFLQPPARLWWHLLENKDWVTLLCHLSCQPLKWHLSNQHPGRFYIFLYLKKGFWSRPVMIRPALCIFLAFTASCMACLACRIYFPTNLTFSFAPASPGCLDLPVLGCISTHLAVFFTFAIVSL